MSTHKTTLRANQVMQITKQAVDDTITMNTYDKVTDPQTIKVLDDWLETRLGQNQSIAVIARSGQDVLKLYEYLNMTYGSQYTVQNITSQRRNDITILSAIGSRLQQILPVPVQPAASPAQPAQATGTAPATAAAQTAQSAATTTAQPAQATGTAPATAAAQTAQSAATTTAQPAPAAGTQPVIPDWATFERIIRDENIKINSMQRGGNRYNQNGPTVNKVTLDWLAERQADGPAILADLNDPANRDARIRKLQMSLLDAQTEKNNLLQRVMDAKNAKLKEQTADIVVCTVHGVKGLEYDHVACFINTESGRSGSGNSDENKRIGYVALTRAKLTECVFCTREKLLKDFEAYRDAQP